MALEFDKQLSRLQKPSKDEMTQEEFDVFEKNVDTMMENWGFINNLFKVLPLNAAEIIFSRYFRLTLNSTSGSSTSRLLFSHRRPAISPTLIRK